MPLSLPHQERAARLRRRRRRGARRPSRCSRSGTVAKILPARERVRRDGPAPASQCERHSALRRGDHRAPTERQRRKRPFKMRPIGAEVVREDRAVDGAEVGVDVDCRSEPDTVAQVGIVAVDTAADAPADHKGKRAESVSVPLSLFSNARRPNSEKRDHTRSASAWASRSANAIASLNRAHSSWCIGLSGPPKFCST